MNARQLLEAREDDLKSELMAGPGREEIEFDAEVKEMLEGFNRKVLANIAAAKRSGGVPDGTRPWVLIYACLYITAQDYDAPMSKRLRRNLEHFI